ncbi:fibronectin type III domain-containing protein, partial [Campylobacter sp.]|uniref:fibronectin type III domain-containing protein n=1 Tax=Campylobacter sp. TaxID=205 RepID=UPI0039E7A49C|nr:ferrous iron transporter A [Campylobacter sp.]
MKNLLKTLCFLALSLLISGCALASLQASKKETLNAELATISNFNTISEMTQIAFEWERSEDPKVAGYNLYRAKDGGELQKIATIKDRFSTHYVDTGLEPNTSYQYAMSTYDKDGAHSQMGSIYTIQTLSSFPAVEFTQVITNLPLKAKIIWSPHEDLRVSSYVIERSKAGANNWSKIAEVKGRLSAEYIDSGLKPEESFD